MKKLLLAFLLLSCNDYKSHPNLIIEHPIQEVVKIIYIYDTTGDNYVILKKGSKFIDCHTGGMHYIAYCDKDSSYFIDPNGVKRIIIEKP